jgi:hypothetical protein
MLAVTGEAEALERAIYQARDKDIRAKCLDEIECSLPPTRLEFRRISLRTVIRHII